jgi:hypothetical protein
VLVDHAGRPADYRDRLVATLAEHLAELPLLRQRLAAPARWRRPRWLPAPRPDWAWHVPQVDLTRADGAAAGTGALAALVARVQATPLPRDRPLWRFTVVSGFAPDRVAVILVLHHALADGMGAIAQLVTLFDPVPGVPPAAPQVPLARRVASTVSGLAQLAADGTTHHRLPGGGPIGYATLDVPLDQLRALAARHRVRVSDVLLGAVAGGLRRALAGGRVPPVVRTAVPLTVRSAGDPAGGNVTAAVIVDLPLDNRPEADRLAAVAASLGRLRATGRVVATRWVMSTGCAVLPAPLLGWFARTVYGGRYFQAIVSNLRGLAGAHRLAGAPVRRVYPLVPPAPGAPLMVGALGWDTTVCLSVSADAGLLPDPTALTRGIAEVLDELASAAVATATTRTPGQGSLAGR